MSPLREALIDYLQIRRALGYKLERAEKLLAQYLDDLDQRGEVLITVDNALGWATLPASGSSHWWAFRLSCVRGFASYLHALDPAHQVPPADLLAPCTQGNAIPLFRRRGRRADRGDRLAALDAETGDLPDPDRAVVGHRDADRRGDPPGPRRRRSGARRRDGPPDEVRQDAGAAAASLDRQRAAQLPAVA